jgi:hypothetical protein
VTLAPYIQPRRQNLSIAERLRQIGLVYYLAPVQTTGTRNSNAFNPNGVLDVILNDGAVGAAAGPSNNLPQAIAFPGTTGEYLDTNGVHQLAMELGRYKQFTINVWVYMHAENTLEAICSVWGTNTGGLREWCLVQNTTSHDYEFRWSSDGANTNARTFATYGAVPTDTWAMLTVRWDGVTLRVRANMGGEDTIGLTGIFFPSTSQFAIGGDTNNFAFNGRVAHLGIWNRYLSNQELFWLWNGGQGRCPVPLAA